MLPAKANEHFFVNHFGVVCFGVVCFGVVAMCLQAPIMKRRDQENRVLAESNMIATSLIEASGRMGGELKERSRASAFQSTGKNCVH